MTTKQQIAHGLLKADGFVTAAYSRDVALPGGLDGPRHPLTDAGNSLRFTEDHEDSLIFVKGLGWHVWDGRRWSHDDDAAYRAAKETAQGIRQEALAIQGDEATKVFQHARNSESRNRLEAMLVLASKGEVDSMGLVTPVTALDAEPSLLNCANGTVNLLTGRSRRHAKKQYLTHVLESAYDPSAKAPRWERALEEIFEGDKELVAWFQRAVGYSATGEPNPEKCVFIPHGSGDNGKSLVLETITGILGGLAHVAAPDTFVTSNQRQGNAASDLASMRGARFVRVPETGDGERLAREAIKTVTGGDTIKARFLYQGHFAYLPRFKIWIATNHLPAIPHTDRATWSRIRVIPFRRSFSPKEQNRNLRTQLQRERQGILTWIVRGAYEWYQQGLGELPLAVAQATFDYRASQDTVTQFIEAELVDDIDGRASRTSLYNDHYVQWCRGEGLPPISRNAFYEALRARGYTETKGSAGDRSFVGLRLR